MIQIRYRCKCGAARLSTAAKTQGDLAERIQELDLLWVQIASCCNTQAKQALSTKILPDPQPGS